MLDNRTFDESQAHAYGVYRWFVCDRWRLVYENDADGNCLCGDLDEFKECVRQGRSLKVGVKQLFGIQNDDSSGPRHVSFSSVMQPLIQDGHVGANCDFILSGAPRWPLVFKDGLALGMVWPWSCGEIVCHLVRPGHLPFSRTTVRRKIQWLVADHAWHDAQRSPRFEAGARVIISIFAAVRHDCLMNNKINVGRTSYSYEA